MQTFWPSAAAMFLLLAPGLHAELYSYAEIHARDYCGAGSSSGTTSATYFVDRGCMHLDNHGSGYASASASYGALLVDLWSGGDSSEPQAMASFSDALKISGSSGLGLLEYTYDVRFKTNYHPMLAEGRATAPGVTYTFPLPYEEEPFYRKTTTVNTTVTGMIPFVFGETFSFGASVGGWLSDVQSRPSLEISATLTSLRVYSGSNQLSGLTYRSDARAIYPFEGATATPEPATWLLMGTTAAMLMAYARLKRNRQ